MIQVHKEITQLLYYSNGGYSWKELYYRIPIHVRRLYIRQIQEIKDKEVEKIDGKENNKFDIGNITSDIKKGDSSKVDNNHLQHRSKNMASQSLGGNNVPDFELPDSTRQKIQEMGNG